MLPAPSPADETLRQRALDKLDVVDTPAELYLDTLVRLTRELFEVETVLISLIDRDRQWFKARIGLDVAETPRDISFCGHAVAARSPLVVEDAHLDPRFADNPVVTGPPFLRFYAGQPLYSSDNQPIGTLCMLHPQPRGLNQQERFRLRDLATLVEGYLQLRSVSQQAHKLREAVDREQRKALIDPLTQLWNRAALNQFFSRELASATGAGLRLGLIYGDLDHFKQVNDQFGHAGGDQVLWESSRRMGTALRPDDLLVRLGGEEFIALVSVHDARELGHIAERMRKAVGDTPMTVAAKPLPVTISLGTALLESGENQGDLLERADRALYLAKKQGRDRTVHAEPAT
ncbi:MULTISPECIES: sensor domain-containing diguanylate cyclase [unclassified Pseudomonas]|uniref:sensor domain-containing diguanylate cyclase n=1 Tax=unclassified Pseudomonas TaxID=196821 RepID=UPI0024499145|nr:MULTISPECIES: sensor domain-containing diguanylate cyclase [unclassified Pseudomonas]MDG9924567.1 sensor domain-containing diguanylate cyclase [Pseudomonas sp. GD04045]MDH0033560.1 sensor domain-containing diguanylate cyclase [Pseudomonas sp. GD04019]